MLIVGAYYLEVGESNAPIIVESYINLGNPNSAKYFEAAYKTFEDPIEEGEIKHIIKHVDGTDGNMLKGTVAHGHLKYDEPEKTYKIMRDLFSTQSVWTTSYEMMLDKLNRQLYLKEEEPNPDRTEAITEEMRTKIIKEVPTVFMNGERFSYDLEDSTEDISSLLRNKLKDLKDA